MNKKNSLIVFLVLYAFSSSASTVGLEWQHYNSSPSLTTQLKDYIFLKWDQKTDFYAGPFYIDAHILTEYSLDKSELFYFNIPELYLSYKYELENPLYSIESIELNVGRKIKIWSLADEYWDMGLWNSLNRWNPLHPVTNGLIGSLLTFNARLWSFDFFLGALHLPNQEVQFLEKEGQFYSGSRWFNPLPNQVDVFGYNYLNIYYLIDSPYLFDVLFQQSYLLSFKTWSKTAETYYWVKWSAADKPVNHLFSDLKTDDSVRVGKEENAEVSAHPVIGIFRVRQRLLSMEWGVDYNNFSTFFTLENTKMRKVSPSPKGWDSLNSPDNFTYFSTLLKYNLLPKSSIQFGYLQTWFQNYNPRVKTNKKPPVSLGRYKILGRVSAEWKTEFLSSKGLRRIIAVNYQYSFLNKGTWLFVKTLYHISPKIYTSVTLDILGAKDIEDYFLNKFRHNDYFSWSLAYAF